MTAPRVYFYCCDELGNLQEDIIALAEGLSDLGIAYYANCDYWLQSTTPGDYLFRATPEVRHQDCDIVVVPYTWPLWVRMGDFKARKRPLPDELFAPHRTWATVFMDNNDGYRTISWEPEFRQFDAILRTKYNARAFHPENMQPWAYGLTRRVCEATADALPFTSRKRAMLVNFGASHPFSHGSRDIAARRFNPVVATRMPLDDTRDDLSVEPAQPFAALMWRQTGGRFSRAYYDRLRQTQVVACFCGDVIPSRPWRPEHYLVGGNRARLRRSLYWMLDALGRRTPRAVGCDSFRFWEALSAGCFAINLDLEHYGVRLPVMPRHGTHYFGVDLGRTRMFFDFLSEEPERIAHIAEAGREWAVEHYAPRAVALRFLRKFYPDFATSKCDEPRHPYR